MGDRELKLIPAKETSEAAPGFAPTGEGVPAPVAGQSPTAYLDALSEGGHLVDASAFLAAALPRREGVWWACRCARSILGPSPSKEVEDALNASEAWAAAPGDVNRRKAMAAAEAAGFGHPAGCVALAAFLSGGSIVPPHLKDVPPPDHAFPKALSGAIQLAAARAEPGAIVEARRRFVDLGLAVARGEDRWKPLT